MDKQQLENTHNLPAIIDAKIAENEPSEVLDDWVQPCGTYGCVLGDSGEGTLQQSRDYVYSILEQNDINLGEQQ